MIGGAVGPTGTGVNVGPPGRKVAAGAGMRVGHAVGEGGGVAVGAEQAVRMEKQRKRERRKGRKGVRVES